MQRSWMNYWGLWTSCLFFWTRKFPHPRGPISCSSVFKIFKDPFLSRLSPFFIKEIPEFHALKFWITIKVQLLNHKSGHRFLHISVDSFLYLHIHYIFDFMSLHVQIVLRLGQFIGFIVWVLKPCWRFFET